MYRHYYKHTFITCITINKDGSSRRVASQHRPRALDIVINNKIDLGNKKIKANTFGQANNTSMKMALNMNKAHTTSTICKYCINYMYDRQLAYIIVH